MNGVHGGNTLRITGERGSCTLRRNRCAAAPVHEQREESENDTRDADCNGNDRGWVDAGCLCVVPQCSDIRHSDVGTSR